MPRFPAAAEKEYSRIVSLCPHIRAIFKADLVFPVQIICTLILSAVRYVYPQTSPKFPVQVGESSSGERGDVSPGSRCTVMPDGQSLIAAGAWQPEKNELATMRYEGLRPGHFPFIAWDLYVHYCI